MIGRSLLLTTVSLSAALSLGDAIGCKKKQPDDTPKPVVSVTPEDTATAPHIFDPHPLKEFADAAAVDGKPPLERARFFYNDGQYWLARLVIEPTALSADSPKEEAELLAKICQAQEDTACLDKCSKKLGRKITLTDAGIKEAGVAPEHSEPDNDFTKARALQLKGKAADARAILEPKVLGGSSSPEETRLLREICKGQRDKMCMAVCDSKLKAAN